MAHRRSRGIALLFHDHGTRRGWWVSVTPRPLFTPGKDPIPIVQEPGWAPGPVWTGAENLVPTGIRSPDRPTCSQSLYRLSYPAHNSCRLYVKKKLCWWYSYLCGYKLTAFQSVFSSTNQAAWKDGRTTGKQRPVSVTIGEYPSGVERRIPTRFNFLPAPAADVRKSASSGDGSNITCQLQSELSQTLSRSNLRKQTDLQVNLFCENCHKPLLLSSWECCLNNTLRYIQVVQLKSGPLTKPWIFHVRCYL